MFEGNCGTINQTQGLSWKKIREERALGNCKKISHLPIEYRRPETLHKQGRAECTLGLDNEVDGTDGVDTTGNEGL